jgi:hypothetical protein
VRPASAFQAAKALLTALDTLDPKSARLALTSIEAERVAPRKKRGESVRIEVWLALTAPDLQQGLAAARELVATWEKDAAVVDAHLFDGYREPGRTASPRTARARQGRVEPREGAGPGTAGRHELDRPETYIRKCACKDRVEIGMVLVDEVVRLAESTDWIDRRWTIRSDDPERAFQRLRIHNYALVLEHDHELATITRIAMTPPIGKGAIECPRGWDGARDLDPAAAGVPAPTPR